MTKTSQISDRTINRIATTGKFCGYMMIVGAVLQTICTLVMSLS